MYCSETGKNDVKGIKAVDGAPELVDVPEPVGDGVKVKVACASICGSDLHMLERGFFGDNIIGHEFAGVAPDGRAVAVEPILGCGICRHCEEGERQHCTEGLNLLGVMRDGGMAEYVLAPAENLVELPTGLDIAVAALVEPLAVSMHGLDRARVRQGERVLVIGAGPIGLAAVAALRGRGIGCDIGARYEHQREAAGSLGAGLEPGDSYDVVIDAVGSGESLRQAMQAVRPLGRVGLLGTLWDEAGLDFSFSMKEAELIAAHTYTCKAPRRNFEEAGKLLHDNPVVADKLVSHRFPLEAAEEAFAAAADRAAGAVKVVFDIGRQPPGARNAG